MTIVLQYPPSMSASDKLLARSIIGKDGGPAKPPPLDRTQIMGCSAEGCHKRFLNEMFLAANTESRHQPKPKTVDAAATELVRAAIADRIESGELKPGQPLIQAKLIEQLGTTRHQVLSAVEQLSAAGVLRYEGAGVTRRVIVVGS
jgi:regulatory GntR family protein